MLNVFAGEQCDGAGLQTANCELNCKFDAWRRYTNEAAGEECDDGNLIDGDRCDSNCRHGVAMGSSPPERPVMTAGFKVRIAKLIAADRSVVTARE